MYPTDPHFDLGNKLESEVDETHEGGAVVWWCILDVVPPLAPTENSDAAIQLALSANPVW